MKLMMVMQLIIVLTILIDFMHSLFYAMLFYVTFTAMLSKLSMERDELREEVCQCCSRLSNLKSLLNAHIHLRCSAYLRSHLPSLLLRRYPLLNFTAAAAAAAMQPWRRRTTTTVRLPRRPFFYLLPVVVELQLLQPRGNRQLRMYLSSNWMLR